MLLPLYDQHKSVSSDDWDVKRQEIAAEHKLPQAQQDLKNCWKARIKETVLIRAGVPRRTIALQMV